MELSCHAGLSPVAEKKTRWTEHCTEYLNFSVNTDHTTAEDCGISQNTEIWTLPIWKHADIQNTVTSLAHQNGMRISRICAWNTSRLAYDGSGEVLRGNKVSDATPYDMCKFQSGKMYNCDLSASYNIGARYFIRGLIKELPDIMTKVSDIGSGTTRTLSTLWKINSAMPI